MGTIVLDSGSFEPFLGSSIDVPQKGTIVPNMGSLSDRNYSLADALFSQVQQRVLALLFGNPDRTFYTREIVRSVDSGVGAVRRELEKLESSGLVSTEHVGNQKHYRANRSSPIFQELHGLVQKTFGLREPLRRFLRPYASQIKAAFVFGSVAKGTDTAKSDIDLMVIGDRLTYSDLYSAVQDAENVLNRPVKPNFVSTEDWRRKTTQDNSFFSTVKDAPKLFIVGSEGDLPT